MRITVPEGKTAIILSEAEAKNLYRDLRLLRKEGMKYFRTAQNQIHESAGAFMLAYVERPA